MENISKNIKFENWVDYQSKNILKIENTPNEQQINNGKLIAENIFEVLIKEFGESIKLETGFLNYDLSQKGILQLPFYNGDALKITSDNNGDVFNYIKDNLNFDSLIWLFGSNKNPQSIYVSYNSENKKQVYKTQFNKELKKVEYIDYEPTAI